MIYNLNNDFDRPKFIDRVKALLDKRVTVELVEKKQKRTTSQNSYLHLLLGYFATEYGCSLDEVKVRFFKNVCNPEIFKATKIHRGREIDYLRSSSELSTAEMTTAIERFRNWSASEAGIYLPAPNEEDFLLFVQQEIERQKEFI